MFGNDARGSLANGNSADEAFASEGGNGGADEFLAIDLRRILALLRRNALWIAGIVVAAVALGLVSTLLMTPYYTARSSVLIEQQADKIIASDDLTPAASYQDADRFLQTQVDVLNSRALAQRVVQAENLATRPDFFTDVGERYPETDDLPSGAKGDAALANYRQDKAIEYLQNHLSVDLPRESRVVSISFKSASPALSAQIANSIADRYIESNLNRKFDSSSYARNFLAQQLQDARVKLEQSENELNRYSRAAGLIRVAGQGTNADKETTLSVTNDSLVQANAAASQATADRAAAEDQWKAIEGVAPLSVPQVLSNQAMQNLIQQKTAAEGQLAAERARHLDDYPTVKALQSQVARIDGEINALGAGIKRSVYLNYKAARDKEDTLRAEVAAIKGDALNEQDRGVQYNILKRVAETNRALYDTLLQRYNELSATAGATSNNVSIVDRAEIPQKPSSPNLIKNLAVAGLLGLILAALFVFIRDQFDDVVRSPLDLEAKLGLSMLGLVPSVQDTDGQTALDAVRRDPKAPVSEAYVSLVTNLTYSTPHGTPKSLVVTSAQAAEGKSTTAFAIALDLARLGRKVLLIDADMRRPTLHSMKDGKGARGLSDILSGNGSLSDVLMLSDDDERLQFVTAGPRPPEPSLLLAGSRFASLLGEAGELFDFVVVDSPPMLGLSDTATIAAHAAAVLFVVDATQGHRGAAKSAIRRLHLVRANVIGAVLTKFDPKAAGGNYSYYGYDYYSYGDADKREAT